MTHDPEPILWLNVIIGVAGAAMLLWTPVRFFWHLLFHCRAGHFDCTRNCPWGA